jgi:hypothetical protein
MGVNFGGYFLLESIPVRRETEKVGRRVTGEGNGRDVEGMEWMRCHVPVGGKKEDQIKRTSGRDGPKTRG